MEWYLKVINEYANFSGRARRQEYWMFFLINFLITMGLGAISALGGIMGAEILGTIGLGAMVLYTLFLIIPSLAVLVRRLHDTGKSGWFYFIGLIPLVGGIILIVFLATEGEPGSNKWGPNPKEEDMSIEDHLMEDEMV